MNKSKNKLVVMLRVKNGIIFIDKWLSNIENLADEIVAIDNGSTDGTYEKLISHPKVINVERTYGFDEGRDKIMVYEMAKNRHPDWILWLDVDEIFEDKLTRKKLDKMMKSKIFSTFWFRRYHFHKDYYHFEASIKKLYELANHSRLMWKNQPSGYFINKKIHNGLIRGIKGIRYYSNIRIKHFGAIDKKYLQKKTDNYVKVDPVNTDMYIKHRDQNLRTWRWYEYEEHPLLVSCQLFLLNLIFALQIIGKLRRKFMQFVQKNFIISVF